MTTMGTITGAGYWYRRMMVTMPIVDFTVSYMLEHHDEMWLLTSSVMEIADAVSVAYERHCNPPTGDAYKGGKWMRSTTCLLDTGRGMRHYGL